MSTMLLIFLAMIAIIVIYTITTHNSIIAYYNACQRAWADVIVQELQKNRLLPTLEKMVEEYKIHEADLLQNVTKLRASLSQISPENADISALNRVKTESKALLSNIHLVAENYPELKASDIYQSFMRELSELEKNIAASLRIFNANVEKFNVKIEVFPNILINQWFSHKPRLNVFTDASAADHFDYKPQF